MLLGNYSVIHKSPGMFLAGSSISNVPSNFQKNGQMKAVYTAESVPDQWGLPVGYYSGWMLPRKAGYIAGVRSLNMSVDTSGSAVSGINLTASAQVIITALADLALIVSLQGSTSLSINTSTTVAGVLFGQGSATLSISTSALIGAIQSLIASGNISINGSATPRADGYMQGIITPYTELSPQGLANAVWQALASQNNVPGTMGEKLNLASSGGVDYDALGQAVWEYVNKPNILNLGDISKIL